MNPSNLMNSAASLSVEEQRTNLIQKGIAQLDMRIVELAELAIQSVSAPSAVNIVSQTEGACYAGAE